MTQPKYNPQELLERIHLMMNYDLSKTCTENTSVITEQISSATRGSEFRMQIPSMPTDYLGSGGGFERSQYANMPKEKYYETLNTLPKVDGSSVSDVLLETRELFFSTGGIVAQVVLSILGAEIGAVQIFEFLDIAIFINDLTLMAQEWRQENLQPWSKEWFAFHLEDGPGQSGPYKNGFLRTLEDLLLVVSGGIFKLAGKGAKEIYGLVMGKFGRNIGEVLGRVSSYFTSHKGFLNKLPKKIGDWGKSKIAATERALNLLKKPKEAVGSVVKNVPKAAIGGVLAYGFDYVFRNYILPESEGKMKKFKDSKTQEVMNLISEISPEMLESLGTTLRSQNPTLFPSKIKKIQIVSDKNNKFVKFIIDGSEYGIIDQKNYLLKKL
jgi:hypothetical protein